MSSWKHDIDDQKFQPQKYLDTSSWAFVSKLIAKRSDEKCVNKSDKNTVNLKLLSAFNIENSMFPPHECVWVIYILKLKCSVLVYTCYDCFCLVAHRVNIPQCITIMYCFGEAE